MLVYGMTPEKVSKMIDFNLVLNLTFISIL